MRHAKNNGGPAFPFHFKDPTRSEDLTHQGMSLEDWFAGQALKGIVGSPAAMKVIDEAASQKDLPATIMASLVAYDFGSAMVKVKECQQ